jgi:hypothetical protein
MDFLRFRFLNQIELLRFCVKNPLGNIPEFHGLAQSTNDSGLTRHDEKSSYLRLADISDIINGDCGGK